MEESYNRHFYLPALLRAGDLDIRMMARNNTSLRVDEYYNSLSKFIDYIPNALENLSRIAALEGSDIDFRNLAILKNLLNSVGCKKFVTVITDIVNSGKRGHNDFAASCAKKLLDDINGIYEYILKAEKKDEPEDMSAGEITDYESDDYLSSTFETFPLGKVLGLLDQEEATRKLRILAVDDSPVLIKTISTLLEEDYKVYGMTDPNMLGKFLGQVTPELFLLDYQMPDITGFELVPIIRSYPEHKNTPIIFLTFLGTPDYVTSALALGACDFIVKPFQGNILREKIGKHIVRKKLF